MVFMVTGLGDSGLRKTLTEVGGLLPKPLDAFIFGGGAMVFRNQKAATKDVDVVFQTKVEAIQFADALKKVGYKLDDRLTKPYEQMEAAGGVWLRPDSRFDVFIERVCGALILSPAIRKRSVAFQEFGNLKTHLFSNEDVILFKAITERLGDLDDIASIARMGQVDWQVILEECKSQSLDRHWYGAVYNKLVELEGQPYRLFAPIKEELLRLDEISILREAYRNRLKKGLTPEQAWKEIEREGATESELREATGD